MTESVKERVKRHEKEYKAWYESIFLANRPKCNHLHCGTRNQSVNATAWQITDNFVASREICTKCGKTLQIWIRNKKGMRKAVEFLEEYEIALKNLKEA